MVRAVECDDVRPFLELGKAGGGVGLEGVEGGEGVGGGEGEGDVCEGGGGG